MATGSDNCDFQDASSSRKRIHGKDQVEEYQKKLQELEMVNFYKKVEKRVLQNYINNSEITKFLYDHVFFPSYGEDDEIPEGGISKEKRKYLRELLEEKEKLNESADQISEENTDLENQIFKKSLYLKDCMLKRKIAWKEAAKVHESTSKGILNYDRSDYEFTGLSGISVLSFENEDSANAEYQMVKQELLNKTNRISELAGILHKLISFSGVKWSNNKNLLEILSSTGNILESGFDVKKPKELKKISDDVIHRLNSVKL